jgi:eukaryotic translation initiation factor 2C
MEWRKRLDYDKLPKIKAWGLDIAKDMMQVKARVLPPPTVQYGAGRIVPARG